MTSYFPPVSKSSQPCQVDNYRNVFLALQLVISGASQSPVLAVHYDRKSSLSSTVLPRVFQISLLMSPEGEPPPRRGKTVKFTIMKQISRAFEFPSRRWFYFARQTEIFIWWNVLPSVRGSRKPRNGNQKKCHVEASCSKKELFSHPPLVLKKKNGNGSLLAVIRKVPLPRVGRHP